VKISVIGCGYLGAVHAASMAKLGHEVVGIGRVAQPEHERDQQREQERGAGEEPLDPVVGLLEWTEEEVEVDQCHGH
jgi:predicted dinucleotide-binding enzyme